MNCIPTDAIVIGGVWVYVFASLLIGFGFIIGRMTSPKQERLVHTTSFLEDQLALQRAIGSDVYLLAMERVKAHKKSLPNGATMTNNPFYATDLEGRAILEQAVAIRKRANVPYPDIDATWQDWLKGEGDVFHLYGFPVLRAANVKVGL